MKSQKNTSQLFITSTFATTDGDTVALLTDNELGIQSLSSNDGTLFTNNSGDKAVTGSLFNLMVKRADGITEVSEEIAVDNITSVTSHTWMYASNVEQVDYIGYDPVNSAGSIDPDDDSVYFMNVELIGTTMSSFADSHRFPVAFETGTSPTQYDIATGLVKVACANLTQFRSGYVPYKFEVVSDEAGAVLGTSVDTLTFAKGSKYFSADDIDDASGTGAVLAVGDLIRVPDIKNSIKVSLAGGTDGDDNITISVGGLTFTEAFDTNVTTTAAAFVTANEDAFTAIGITITSAIGVITFTNNINYDIYTTATATGTDMTAVIDVISSTTDPVYKITALDTTTNVGTLDREYQGKDFTAEDTSFVRIAKATGEASDCGVKITGITTPSTPGYVDTELTRFLTSISVTTDDGTENATTLTRNAVAPIEEFGSIARIKQLEAELMGSKGVEYRNSSKYEVPGTTYGSLSDTGYDIVHIQYNKISRSNLGEKLEIPAEVIIAIDESDNAVADILAAIGQS